MQSIFIGALALLGCVACQQQAAKNSSSAAQATTPEITLAAGQLQNHAAAPAFQLLDKSGEYTVFPRAAARAQGVVDIYFFWATWCPYCKQLMPHLQSIVDEYAGKVAVQAINIRENGKPQTYLDNNGYVFNLYLDGDAVAELYGVKGTPGLIIVDSAGRIRFDMSDLLAPSSKALEGLEHGQRAQRIAPWWAAEIRQALADIVNA